MWVISILLKNYCIKQKQKYFISFHCSFLFHLYTQQENDETRGDAAVVMETSEIALSLIRLKVWTYDPMQRMKYLAVLVDGCKGMVVISIH